MKRAISTPALNQRKASLAAALENQSLSPQRNCDGPRDNRDRAENCNRRDVFFAAQEYHRDHHAEERCGGNDRRDDDDAAAGESHQG